VVKKRLQPNLRYHPGIFLVGLRRSTINPSLMIAGLQSEISTQDRTNTKRCYPLVYKMPFKHGESQTVLRTVTQVPRIISLMTKFNINYEPALKEYLYTRTRTHSDVTSS
jgi:hypothetical protein